MQSLQIILALFLLLPASVDDWGFYGHKKINRMAVFCLPEEVMGFYKENIEYITFHAVDPDKRRYALKNEQYRHYIDLDKWDTLPFVKVPRELPVAILKYGQLYSVNENSDTTYLDFAAGDSLLFYKKYLFLDRYDPEVKFNPDTMNREIIGKIPNDSKELIYDNDFVRHGVLPYFLEDYYKRLVLMMTRKNIKNVLKISADIGHYIGDAHVPLHTTINYNGQLTNQLGLHAFWESRLPELFADDYYNYVVGQAEYVTDKSAFFWDIISESHSLLDQVFNIEKELKLEFPADQQLCFDERNKLTIHTQCPEFAQAYHERLDGMVEKRMQDAILAISSIWYSAWIDAGQPDLRSAEDVTITEEEQSTSGDIINARPHGE